MSGDTTPALYAIKLIEVLREAGIDCLPFIHQAELTARELEDREQEVSLTKYLALVQAAVHSAGIDDLGFLVGEHTGPLEHGVLGYAILGGSTLHESLQRYARYQGLVGPLLEVSLDLGTDTAQMLVRPLDTGTKLHPDVLRYFIQEWLANWNPWSNFIGIDRPFFDEVLLGLPGEEFPQLYQQHMQCPVRLCEGPTVARFPARHLELALQHTNETINALCHEQCELLLEAQQLQHGLTAEIHRRLARRPGDLPGMEDVARQLNMTSRTLRRHLQKENTRFQDVVVSHRIAMARRYLQETSLPAFEIANLVGYADPANFYRTFRGLEGVTPQDFRTANQARTSDNDKARRQIFSDGGL